MNLQNGPSCIHWRELMESTEQAIALQKRVLLAKKHWGLFFSKLPYRVPNLQSLPESPLEITARPAENSAAISVDGL